MMLRSRRLSVVSHEGKSCRKATCSGMSDRVLSATASCQTGSCFPVASIRCMTSKPRRFRAVAERTSFKLSWPFTDRPHLTCREANNASVVENVAASLPRFARRQNHIQHRATTSATASARSCAQRKSRNANRACISIFGMTVRKAIWWVVKALRAKAACNAIGMTSAGRSHPDRQDGSVETDTSWPNAKRGGQLAANSSGHLVESQRGTRTLPRLDSVVDSVARAEWKTACSKPSAI